MKCSYIKCDLDATTKGFVFGRVEGSQEPDKFIPVNACDKHKQIEGFFEDIPVFKEETK